MLSMHPAAPVQAAFYKKRILFHPMIYAWFMGAFSIHNTSKVGRERFWNGLHSHQLRAISMDQNRFNKFICFPQWHKIGIKLKWIRSSLIQYFSFLMSWWRYHVNNGWHVMSEYVTKPMLWTLKMHLYGRLYFVWGHTGWIAEHYINIFSIYVKEYVC